MDVRTALCIEEWAIEARNGDRQECHWGHEYTISAAGNNGKVMLFSRFWVPAPARIFTPPEKQK